MKIGRQLAERFYSDSEYEEERLYSTGSDELDELLERAFCEGYEYAQREFAEKEEKKEKKKKKKYENESHRGYGRAIIVGGAPGGAGRYVGKREVEKALEEGDDIKKKKRRGLDKATKFGAISGAGLGVAGSLAAPGNAGQKIARAVGTGTLYGTLGAAGARWGTSRNNREWRRKVEDDD